jgi:lipopolysaccharide export system protein LptA
MSRVNRVPPLLLLAILAWRSPATAQDAQDGRVEIRSADSWEYDDAIAPGAQRLKGNVLFAHADALMRCDSAYLFEDQRIEAFSRITVQQGDSLFLQGDRLHYKGRDRTARIEGNVVVRDRSMKLETPSLDHDLRNRRGSYTQGGRITSADGSVLTSDQGVYLAGPRLFQFSRNVRSDHPERTIACDTMHYAPGTNRVLFFGPSVITLKRDSTIIRTTRGTFDTANDRALFSRRSSVDTKGRLLEGDSLDYDKRRGVGRAWGHVVLTDTAADMITKGDHGTYAEGSDEAIVTGGAELIFLLDTDSLHLHADSLIARPDTSGGPRRVTARRGVRFFKNDLQGTCDTLIYSEADSLIRMFHRPVLWSGEDQITGRHLRIQLQDGAIHRLYAEQDCFLMSRVDSSHFDQVTGISMTGVFADNALHRLLVEGNARTIYFAQEGKPEEGRRITAVNRADCSRISVGMREGAANTITFMEQPDATLYPLDQVPPEELRMQGAEWREAERPADRLDIFRRGGQ